MNTDDRGPLDLTKQVDDLTQTVDGYKQLVETQHREIFELRKIASCLLYTSPSPRDATLSRMPSSA